MKMDYGDKTLDTHKGEGDWTVGWLEDDIAWYILSPLFPHPQNGTNFMWGPSRQRRLLCSVPDTPATPTDRPVAAAAIMDADC